MRTGKNNIKIFTSTLMLFILSFALLFSSPASAIDITVPVSFNKGYFYPYWSDSNNKTWASGGYSYGNNFDYASSTAQYFRSNSNAAITASKGQFVSLTGAIVISVTSTSQAVSIQANPRQYFSVSNTTVDCPLIDITDTSFEQYQSGNTTWLLRYNFTSICRMTSNVTNNIAMNFNLIGGSTSGTDYIRFFPSYMAVWDAQDGFDDSAIISAINSVNSTLNTVNNSLNSINGLIGNTNNKLDDLLDGMGDLKTLQEDANDDANARYQDEKDTINNAANDAENNVSSQDFSFTLPNPFQAWFGGFSDNECVDIPNLAQWLHSNETHICTPWPGTVRTVVTTVTTGLCMLLLFNFIINWVKKNDTGGN